MDAAGHFPDLLNYIRIVLQVKVAECHWDIGRSGEQHKKKKRKKDRNTEQNETDNVVHAPA